MVPSAPSVPNGAPIPEALIPAAPRPSGIPTDDIVYTPYALSMGDGFKFGCGMVLSLVVTVMIVVLIVALGFLIASLAGVALPIGSLGR
ncbi:MAG: hypothetical protein ACKVVP_19260 [Chloroflexota bacterium]